ncbi:MAG TPA: sodium-translocating pyrophosphatase [Caldilineae bacterium]|nr:sodium-translocating pyrophosphatase [Caldilineae bacterium]HIE37746.1 sodium-translocating pyrophosphatase [Anaerolineae bacterium]HIQ01570.1 sodium-translocating pyrophosphatase [Anaerolineales bacterium]
MSLLTIYFTPLAGIFALVFVWVLARWVLKQDPGTPRMQEVAGFIQQGANAFLRREFRAIAYFIVGLAALLLAVFWPQWQIAFGFVCGALASMLAITIGMNVATRANVRTTQAARTLPGKALTIAFRGGATMGLTIVAFNLLGISFLAILFGVRPDNPENVSMLVGFGFGASLASLFAQLGGGIYTKGADVGADLVGKVEVGIPEDDPRNAAVIADLVGDNVGDCAGRGADLFESGSDNLVATMIMGLAFMNPMPEYGFAGYGFAAVLFPLLTRSIGAIGAVLGVLAVRGTGKRDPIASLNLGFFTTGIFSVIAFFALSKWVMHDMRLFWCLTLGLAAALVSALIVQYYTGSNAKPVQEIAKAATSGPGINIISGMAYGFESAVLPKVFIAMVNVAAYMIMGGGLPGFFGIAAATLGITEMKGIIMAGDAFGPIADNAGGIAEMSGVGEEVGTSADVLDAAGNITKAITKGYSMSCALMTSVVILFTYITEISRHMGMPLTEVVYHARFVLVDPVNITGIMIGSTIPFLFSAQTLHAVGRTAYKVVDEVRRQFREIPGLLEGKVPADYTRCVDIATRDALKGMIWPTVWGVVFPLAMGFVFGAWALAAFLIGVKIIGATLAMFMFNSGGAWDNAKKFVEDGHLGGKGSDAHRSSVIGDTVGDPLKDAAGPSLHILIKLQNILSITMLPLFLEHGLHLFQ